MDIKKRCESCNNCKDARAVTVQCLSYEVAMDEGLIDLYNHRQTEEGTGYVHTDYPKYCRWDSNIIPPPPVPPVPEVKLLHSPFNWGQYKEVKQ